MSTGGDDSGRHRRDFLQVAAGTFVGVGACLALVPLIQQGGVNPSTPLPETPTVDLAGIPPGRSVTVRWRGQPVAIRHRTPDEIVQAATQGLDGLPDTAARSAISSETAPALDENRHVRDHAKWLVVVPVCTHLGCLLKETDPMQENGTAWFCPCHAARYDISGRLRSGPAQTNLPVPPHRFVSPTTIEIGRT